MKIPSRKIDTKKEVFIAPTERLVARVMIDFFGGRVVVTGVDMATVDGKQTKVREVNRMLVLKDAAAFMERVDKENVSLIDAALDVLDAPQPDVKRRVVEKPVREKRGGLQEEVADKKEEKENGKPS